MNNNNKFISNVAGLYVLTLVVGIIWLSIIGKDFVSNMAWIIGASLIYLNIILMKLVKNLGVNKK